MTKLTPFLALTCLVWFAGCSKEEGCTYPEACNFNPDAVVDDGSCDYSSCSGCTDPTALNYDAGADTDDGSCVYDPAVSTADCVSNVDFDEYSYPVVGIGGQCWFAENLRTSTFQDGTEIPFVNSTAFPDLESPARTIYNNSNIILESHGHLYNGFAASTATHGGICPSGWHFPTELDWVELESFLIGAGFGDQMGTALKSTSGWSAAGNGDDAFGFNGIGGGLIWPDGGSYNYNNIGAYWTSSTTAATPESGNYRQLANTTDQMANGSYWSVTGCSVRCIAD